MSDQFVLIAPTFTNSPSGGCEGCGSIAVTSGMDKICVGTSNNEFQATLTGLQEPVTWQVEPPNLAKTNTVSGTTATVIGLAASAGLTDVVIRATAGGIQSAPYRITVVGLGSFVTSPDGIPIGGPTNLYCWQSNAVITVTALPSPLAVTNQLPSCWQFQGGTVSNSFVHTVDRSVPQTTAVWAKAGTMVSSNVIVVERVQINTQGKQLLRAGGETNRWTASGGPTNFAWSSSAPWIAELLSTNMGGTEGLVIGKSPGTAGITARSRNGSGCGASSNTFVVGLDVALQGLLEATEEEPGGILCTTNPENPVFPARILSRKRSQRPQRMLYQVR